MTARNAALTSCAQSASSPGASPWRIRELLGVFVGMLRQLSFGAFTLDVESRQLHRGADAQPVHLAEGLRVAPDPHRGSTPAISKRELHERLWPETFVSEATLSSLVAEVRDALGERARQAQFVRTLHGYGYSFAAHATAPASSASAITNWVVCEGREIALADGEHILGRDTDAKVELRSPAVSRHHARIVIQRCIGDAEGSPQQERDVRPRAGSNSTGATGRRRRDQNRQLRAQLPDCQRQGLNQDGRPIVTAGAAPTTLVSDPVGRFSRLA